MGLRSVLADAKMTYENNILEKPNEYRQQIIERKSGYLTLIHTGLALDGFRTQYVQLSLLIKRFRDMNGIEQLNKRKLARERKARSEHTEAQTDASAES
jgi:hypothetical protein